MAEPKSQTLQQRFGFSDNDLKTSNHDEIMMWLDGKAENLYKSLIKLRYPEESLTGRPIYKIWEKTIVNKGYVIGFIDMCVRDGNTFTVNFEVKTNIPSLGELIRQIQMYQVYCDKYSETFCIVSPETKFSSLLRSQNIYSVHYPSGEIL